VGKKSEIGYLYLPQMLKCDAQGRLETVCTKCGGAEYIEVVLYVMNAEDSYFVPVSLGDVQKYIDAKRGACSCADHKHGLRDKTCECCEKK
jgi:hypothetical protein